MKPIPTKTNAITRFFKESFQLPTLLGVTEQAETDRNNLAIAATAVVNTPIATAAQNEIAIGVSRDIQSYLRRGEEFGLNFRRPINDFLKLVKKTQDDHYAPLVALKDQIDNLALGFAQAERRRVEEAERKQREEYAKAEAARAKEAKRLADEQALREAAARAKQAEIDRNAKAAADAAAALVAKLNTPVMQQFIAVGKELGVKKSVIESAMSVLMDTSKADDVDAEMEVERVSDLLVETTKSSERSKIAQSFFGQSGLQMIPILDAMRKQREDAEAARYLAQRKQDAAEEARKVSEAALAAKREADAVAAAASEQRVMDVLRQPAPEAAKAAGSTVKTVMRFEVVDAATVYRFNPSLCKIEVKPSAVLAVCFAAKDATELAPDLITVPGLKLWWAEDLTTRRR